MFSKDRVLTLDIGTSKIVIGEFSVGNSSSLVLTRYVVRELDSLSSEAGTSSMASVSETVRTMLMESGIKPAPLYAMLSGQAIFPRFVKLPSVSSEKVDEMVRYEASENLPFPIDEVVWDYQVVADAVTAELDALIVATKSETALDAAACAEGAGLQLEMVDAIPFALYNCIRFNCPENDGCTMLLDIGARSTNLVFVEGSKIFTRSITVAGNAITNEIARSLAVSPAEAEKIKKDIGFVALGGTYAVVDDETADKVSKVIRNVITRLHSEVNRSINFYRSQQGGSAPTKLLLTGGASLTRHMDTFFREKLGIEVEYLNPFANVAVDESLQEETEALFLMASSVGLALRACMKCPVEINLMPPAILAARRFGRRLPFFAVAVVGLVLTLFCWFLYARNLKTVYTKQNDLVKARIEERQRYQNEIDKIKANAAASSEKTDYLSMMVASRGSYLEALKAVEKAMIKDTWVISMTFEPGQDENSSGYMNIVVCGFKRELDNLVTDKSAGELLLSNLLASDDLFVEDGSKVERERSMEGERLSELHIKLKLSRKLGVFDEKWLARWAVK